MVSVACTKPKDHGLAAELWTHFGAGALSSANMPRRRASASGREPAKARSGGFSNEHDIKPHKIRYYLERRDPEFDRKMQEVLMVYRDVSLYSDGAVHDGRPNPIYTVSVDEKPGVQALGLTAPDLPPVPGKAADAGARLRVRPPRHRLDPGRYRSALRSHLCPSRGPAPQRASSSPCLKRLMPTTRRRPSSAWSSTTIRPISRRRPWPTWPRVPGASSMFIRPSMARGSTSSNAPSRKWHAPFCAISASPRWTNSRRASSKASMR